MENKIKYQSFIMIFLAYLAITDAVENENRYENLFAPLYLGDPNVMEGKQFRIMCRSERPIKWFKDGEAIENHFIRHGNEDEFSYVIRENESEVLFGKGKVESTLSVNKALLRHKGTYKCSAHHKNSHYLNVHPYPQTSQNSQEQEETDFDSESDHEEKRERFEFHNTSTYSTANKIIEEITETTTFLQTNIEIISNVDDELFEEPPPYDFGTISQISSTIIPTLSSLTYTTSQISIPPNSVVLNQSHLETHQSKGKIKPGNSSEIVRLGKPLVLSCQAENPDETKLIEWSKYVTENDNKLLVKVEKINAIKGRYSVKPAEGSFIIERPNENDEGEYVCKTPTDERTIKVSIVLIVKIPENIYVVEGEKLEINCIVKGSNPKITWTFRKENDTEEMAQELELFERIKLSESDDIENAKLTIENVKQEDRGFFGCVGKSDHMVDEVKSEGLVRVKDKFAALWPFIGICAEVFVLCAIILIYEKRRNTSEDNDSDTDQDQSKK